MSATYFDALTPNDIYARERQVEEVLRRKGAAPILNPHMLPLMQGMVAGLYARHRTPGTPEQAPTLRVSERAITRAWYDTAKHQIVLPRQAWAFTSPLTLAHEIAHACVNRSRNQQAAHGEAWRRMYVAVASDLISPEAGRMLAETLDIQ